MGLFGGQTIFRSSFEYLLRSIAANKGRIVDLGGVKYPIPGYAKALGADMRAVTTVNISSTVGADFVADAANTGLLECSFEQVWCFNLLEHVEFPERVLTEAKRLSQEGAHFIGVVPFLLGIHGEPDDYARYTKSKLISLLQAAGFHDVRITVVGRGPFIASIAQAQPLLHWFFSVPSVVLAWLLDGIIFYLRPKWREKWPLGYLIEAVS